MPFSKSAIGNRKSPITAGFTLIELLVVISILGILAAITVPALKDMGKANLQASAARQLLDDVGRARQLAMSQRTTVYMVFVPTNFWLPPFTSSTTWTNNISAKELAAAVSLSDKQLTGYAFVSFGSLGDQPGQHQPRYLSAWQALPEGSFIAPQKFYPAGTLISSSAQPLFKIWNQENPHADQNRLYAFLVTGFPFPLENSSSQVNLPFIAFNHLGQLTLDGVNLSSRDEYIPLVQGVIGYATDPATKAAKIPSAPLTNAVTERPPGNGTNISYSIIHIDALTGRAALEQFKMK